MRTFNVIAALTALLAAAGFSAADFPQCSVTAIISAPKTVKAGRKFTASASIRNTGTTALDDLYLQFQLPDYMLPMKARAPAFATKHGPAPLLEGRYVYFRNMRLPARKTLRVKVSVGVPTCQAAGSVQLKGLVYRLDENRNIACTHTATPAATTVARKKAIINRKNAIQGNCTAPPAPPTQGYTLLGSDTLCLQAEPLELLAPARALTASEEGRGRQLMPSASPAELQCWGCCGFALDATASYYFNVAADGQCYCCAECDPVYAPDWVVR